ncbi:acyl-CoA dehydrogenase family protein [Delftia lacustris]|uniref:acyl-CoA dehydrogenase family protein n=1 Tax=Delftia lacustris TaxID=558537 RepID=UPI00193B9BAF|nr:acyl-CoA dehydrogenase family protein [Delftia lacustris]
MPALRLAATDIERARRLPVEVVQQLRAAGVFRAAMPVDWGGPAMSSLEQTELVEILATGDVSAAWCAMIGMDSGIYAGFLRRMWPGRFIRVWIWSTRAGYTRRAAPSAWPAAIASVADGASAVA